MLRWTTNRQRPRRLPSILAALLLLGLLWAAQPIPATHAASFIVTKTSDTNDGACNNDCSLREAIIAANTTLGPSTITLDVATYTLSIAGSGDASLGDLNITGELTITGALSSTTIIDAKGIDRIFYVDEGSRVSLANMTIRNGSSQSGGGIANWGDLRLSNIIVENNTAEYAGGIYNASSRLDADSIIVRNNRATINAGGIIGTEAGIRISNSLVEGNQSANRGGGISIADGGLTLDSVVVRNNSASGHGGGLFTHVSGIWITESIFSNNKATGDGGGIYNLESGISLTDVLLNDNSSAATGGGIVNTAWTVATLRGVTVRDNRAVLGGGGIVNRDASRMLLQATSIRTNQAAFGAGILNLVDETTVAELHLLDSIVQGNTTTDPDEPNGGGIYSNGSVVLTSSLVIDNRAALGYGGGIYSFGTVQTTGLLTITDSRVQGNSARYGGGIFTERQTRTLVDTSSVSDNSAGSTGGGLYATGRFTLTNSSLVNNTAAAEGGGMIFTGLEQSAVRNSTISGNQSGATGGGVHNSTSGTLLLNNVTITNNSADGTNAGNGGGGGIANPFGTITLHNSIVAGNTNNASGTSEEDCAGTMTSGAYNLIADPTGCVLGDLTNSITGQDAQLGPLEDNGGPTLTHNPLPASPVIDTGNPDAPGSSQMACEALDQRGISRPEGPRCDIGAVERLYSLNLEADFESTTGLAGVPTILHFTVMNSTDQSISGIGFTSTLSDGLKTTTGDIIANTCGGSAVAGAGSESITLSDGNVAANQSCALSLAVVAPIGGTYGVSSGPITGDGVGSGRQAAAMVVVYNPAPLVSDAYVSQSSNGGDGILTVSGSGFVPVSTVMLELEAPGTAASITLPTTFVSATELRAQITAQQLASLQTATITVVNPNPGGGGSNERPVSNLPAQRSYTVYLPVSRKG